MPKLVVSAPFFNNSEKKLFATFKVIAKSEADEVLLRDISCQKREPSVAFYKKTIKLLQNNGKKIILNTPVIVRQNDKAFNALNHLVDSVEVNNIGYLPFLKNRKTILGPHLKIYNWKDLEVFENIELDRFVVPYGLTKKQTEELLREVKCNGEIFVFGLEPIALSWNCFLASFLGKNRFNCQKSCFGYPSGMNLSSLNNISLFKVMGTEALSQKVYSVLNQVEYLKRKEVKYFRVNPHLIFEKTNLVQKINELKEVIDGKKSHKIFEGLEKCNGTFFENTPGYEYVSDEK